MPRGARNGMRYPAFGGLVLFISLALCAPAPPAAPAPPPRPVVVPDQAPDEPGAWKASIPISDFRHQRIQFDWSALPDTAFATVISVSSKECDAAGASPVFTPVSCPELFELDPAKTASAVVVTSGADVEVELSTKLPRVKADDTLFDGSKLWMEDIHAVSACEVWAGSWQDCGTVTLDAASQGAADTLLQYRAAFDVQPALATTLTDSLRGSETQAVRLRFASGGKQLWGTVRLYETKSSTTLVGTLSGLLAHLAGKHTHTQIIGIDQSDPDLPGALAYANLGSRHLPMTGTPIILAVMVPADHTVELTLSKGEVGFESSFWDPPAAQVVGAPPLPPVRYARLDFSSLKPGEAEVTVKLTSTKADAVARSHTYRWFVDRPHIGQVRVGFAGAYVFPRDGAPVSRYDVVGDAGTEGAIRDLGPNEWIHGEATVGMSFYLGDVRTSNLAKPHAAIYAGTGVLKTNSTDPIDFIPSVHIGPELTLGSGMGVALTVSARATSRLAADLGPGDPVAVGSTLSKRVTATFGLGLVLNLSTAGFKLFKGESP